MNMKYVFFAICIPTIAYADYATDYAKLKREQEYYALNNQFYAAKIKNLMTTHQSAGWLDLDLTYIFKGTQITTDVFMDYALTEHIGLFFGFQVYVLNYKSNIPNLPNGERALVGMNVPVGVNIYAGELGRFAAGIRVYGGTGQRLTDDEIDQKARGLIDPSVNLSRIITPYFFYDGPANKFLTFRTDAALDTVKSSVSRFGIEAVTGLLGIEIGPLYDVLNAPGGEQRNLAAMAFYRLKSEAMSVLNDYTPKIAARFGEIAIEDIYSSTTTKSIYTLLEYSNGFIGGVSYRRDFGFGFRAGYSMVAPNGHLDLSLMLNYPYSTLYGSFSQGLIFHFSFSMPFT